MLAHAGEGHYHCRQNAFLCLRGWFLLGCSGIVQGRSELMHAGARHSYAQVMHKEESRSLNALKSRAQRICIPITNTKFFFRPFLKPEPPSPPSSSSQPESSPPSASSKPPLSKPYPHSTKPSSALPKPLPPCPSLQPLTAIHTS